MNHPVHRANPVILSNFHANNGNKSNYSPTSSFDVQNIQRRRCRYEQNIRVVRGFNQAFIAINLHVGTRCGNTWSGDALRNGH